MADAEERVRHADSHAIGRERSNPRLQGL